MDLNYTLSIIAFVYWLVGTLAVFALQIFKPMPIQGKLNIYNPRHFLLVTVIMSWLAMWCFRFLTECA